MTSTDQGPARHTVYLGLGSNLGDRQLSIARALGRLRREFDVVAASPAYETEPVGVVDQPKFVNMVVRASTDLAPAEVLAKIKGIERELGRRMEREARYGPRPIDIDLLLYDDMTTAERVPVTGGDDGGASHDGDDGHDGGDGHDGDD
ncbi:MAG: 2-amino-4-hydroxy-6-hydroxymethyldihydropteridine diphosphokinase, partial [Anaerolineae bacterium]